MTDPAAPARRRPPTSRTPLDVRPRVWFNADLESKNYIVPGLIAVIMMVIAALLTSLTVAREWERGTMEQLISTPVTGRELILGKLIPYFAIGMFDVLLAVLMGQFLFHVPLRGSVALLFGMASIFLVGVLAMGMLISIVTKSQLLASQLAMTLTFLPAFLLSGFMFADRQHAAADPVGHVPRAGPVFRGPAQGDLPQGRGPGDPRRRRAAAGRLRASVMVLRGQREVQEEADVMQVSDATMFERIRHMLIKEFIQVFRDPRMRTVIFVIPCIQVLVIGYAVTTDVRHVPHGRLRPRQQRRPAAS